MNQFISIILDKHFQYELYSLHLITFGIQKVDIFDIKYQENGTFFVLQCYNRVVYRLYWTLFYHQNYNQFQSDLNLSAGFIYFSTDVGCNPI